MKGRVLSAGEVPCADQRWQPLPTTDGNSVGASTKRPHHDTHPRASALARVWRCTQCTIKSTIPYLNSPVVREALLHKGVGRRTRRLLVQVQGAAAELRNANIHLLQRITDVTRRSRWAHFAETTDLHLADLRRQAEEHHRDRKPPRCRAGARAQGVPAGGQDGGTGRAHAAGAGPWPLPEGDEAWL